MTSELTAPVETAGLAAEVEELVAFTEPESAHRDTTECKSAALLLGLLLASPPAPRPKKDTR
jgi:hypothetical protein